MRDRLLQHPKVSNLNSITGAIVPLITFDYEEINIDLQLAILPLHTLPENLDVLDNNILTGVDPATEKSLNGPRVTELLIKLTPNRESFIQVLRIVRRWAKRRGLYSNKMGYLGGVNYCILTCFVNQLYPTAAPSTLLFRFFMVLSNWKWPAAIQVRLVIIVLTRPSCARRSMPISDWKCGRPTTSATGITSCRYSHRHILP